MSRAPARPVEEEPLPLLFVELERVLADEARALKKLDRDGIEQAASQKEKLWAELTAAKVELTAGQRVGVERVKKTMLRNHMLLAHARDSVRQVLGTATGKSTTTGRPSTPVLGGLRLDVRG